jgi:ligand-binding SRPBCC domain-containing protein
MTTIEAITIMNAPIEAVFRASLSIDLELSAAKNYGIRAVAGVTSGFIGAGQRVTWQVKQFGVRVTHTTEITGFDAPSYFQDRMVQGMFRSFCHDHFFLALDTGQTEMRDRVRLSMPFFMGGKLAEILFVKRRLVTLLYKRNVAIQNAAEESAEHYPSKGSG